VVMLEGLILAVGAKATDAVIGASVSQLVDAVLEAREEELRILGEVDLGMRALLDGPFRVGVSALEDATASHRKDDERDDLLVRAREAFRSARALEHDKPSRIALIELHLAMTWLALDSWPDAEKHLELAHESLVRATARLDAPQPVSVGQRLLGRSAAPDPRLPLVAFLEAVRDLRIRLGSRPTSVPAYPLLFRGTTFARGSIEGHSDHYGSGTDQDSADLYWTTYARNPGRMLAWQHLFQYRSSALEQVASGAALPPDSMSALIDVGLRKSRGEFSADDEYRDEWQSDVRLLHEVDIDLMTDILLEMMGCRWSAGHVDTELITATATDLLRSRHAGWPDHQRALLEHPGRAPQVRNRSRSRRSGTDR
jgi:hypothetical protein